MTAVHRLTGAARSTQTIICDRLHGKPFDVVLTMVGIVGGSCAIGASIGFNNWSWRSLATRLLHQNGLSEAGEGDGGGTDVKKAEKEWAGTKM